MSKYTAKQLKEMNELLLSTYERALEDLKAIDIPVSENIKEIKINSVATTRWGICKRRAGVYTIEVSDTLCLGYTNQGLYETICHELMHSCEGAMNHGPNWLQHVDKCNSIYGTKIKATNDLEEKGFTAETYAACNKYKYEVWCEDCNRMLAGYNKRTKTLKNIKYCACGRCHKENLKVITNW